MFLLPHEAGNGSLVSGSILEPQEPENSGIFVHLCETFKAKMKQILQVCFEERLTPATCLKCTWSSWTGADPE